MTDTVGTVYPKCDLSLQDCVRVVHNLAFLPTKCKTCATI